MEERLKRTALLFGDEAIEKLKNAHVAIFGIGGVGGYVAEALARSGVGKFTLVDNDFVSESNINRQIIALNSTVGKYKVDVMKERISDINPDAEVFGHKCFYLPDEDCGIDFSSFTIEVSLSLPLSMESFDIPIYFLAHQFSTLLWSVCTP